MDWIAYTNLSIAFAKAAWLRETGEQFGKTVFEAEVFAVAGVVLADEIDFAHTHSEHACSFVDNALTRGRKVRLIITLHLRHNNHSGWRPGQRS